MPVRLKIFSFVAYLSRMFKGLDQRRAGLRAEALAEAGHFPLRIGVGGVEREGFGQVGDG